MATLGEDLLNTVNRLQDLVFNTIGTDSLDLPQIVCETHSRSCYGMRVAQSQTADADSVP